VHSFNRTHWLDTSSSEDGDNHFQPHCLLLWKQRLPPSASLPTTRAFAPRQFVLTNFPVAFCQNNLGLLDRREDFRDQPSKQYWEGNNCT